jgi:predicted enzyme related to lactoylglutathione lyase
VALAQPLQLPPIVAPPSEDHHVGKVILLELITPDLAAAERFYGGLFGWTFRNIEAGRTKYAEALLDGRAVAGLFQRAIPHGERRQPEWLSFFAVGDVDAAERLAVQRGAKLLFGPRSFANRGREAVLADPQGAVFGILASSSGDPPDFLVDPGEWIWSSLITSDPDNAAGFYQTLFQYDVFELPSESAALHLLLASNSYARASVNSLPPDSTQAHSSWINYVRVDDAEKTTARAVALGGRLLVKPHEDRQGGKLALIADPDGAPFGVLEWPASKTETVSPR